MASLVCGRRKISTSVLHAGWGGNCRQKNRTAHTDVSSKKPLKGISAVRQKFGLDGMRKGQVGDKRTFA